MSSLTDPKHRKGVTGRAVMTRMSQLVHDTSQDDDYISIHDKTRSELTTPLIEGVKVLGVINLESEDVATFSEEDKTTLETLAKLAVVAIERQRLIFSQRQAAQQLERTQKDFLQKLSVLGHELRNPLGYVKAYATEMLENPGLADVPGRCSPLDYELR